MFLRAIIVAIGVLVLGVGAFRLGIVDDQRLALWPTFDLLKLESGQGQQPLSTLAPVFAVQVTIWTLLVYLLLTGLGSLRRSLSRRP